MDAHPFDQAAADYAAARPRYPAALFDALAALAPAKSLARECGTGSGQAARALATRFERVFATDISAIQLAHAPAHPGLSYAQQSASRCALAGGSTDLVTAAAAIHWFDLDAFYTEVRRVLRRDGVIAIFSYFDCLIEADLRPLLDELAHHTLADYWDPRVELSRSRYRTLPFPFDEIALGDFSYSTQITLDRLRGFLRSWSAAQAYASATGNDPLAIIDQRLRRTWGDPCRPRPITWPIFVRCGRIDKR